MKMPQKWQKDLMVGVQYSYVPNLKEEVAKMATNRIQYVCSNVLPYDVAESSARSGKPIPYDKYWPHTMLEGQEWTLGVVGVLPNIDKLLEDQDPDAMFMKRAVKSVNRQIDYCHHLGVPAIMFEITDDSNNLAQIIHARLNQMLHHFTFWAKVEVGSSGSGVDDVWDNGPPSWLWFNKFRKLCGGDQKLRPVLQLNADLPDDENEINRWLGENPVAICLNLRVFQTNEGGFPVLSRRHQDVVKKFFVHDVQVILEVSGLDHSVNLEPYRRYMAHIHQCYLDAPQTNPLTRYSRGWENHLQTPLQPLMDNLESSTYATFELDPSKYKLYKTAITGALSKLALDRESPDGPLIIVVAGAGRGPLVTAARDVAHELKIEVRIYALEKNPNAGITLQNLNNTLWNGEVTVVCTDMRHWNAPEKADLIVSELLGSFGDNELSPECLDGAQRFLKPDGIIIPEEYSSYIAPIMSHGLFTELTKYRDYDKNPDMHLETPYVVYMTKKYDIAEPKKLFTFIHPIPNCRKKERTNDRYQRLEFEIMQDCDCHGFAGYFDSVLYENVTMSIHPDTHTPFMFSWFPMYIPIKAAISLKKGDRLVVGFWRKSTSTKVWYEWTIISPQTLPIHNVNGRSSSIGLDIGQPE